MPADFDGIPQAEKQKPDLFSRILFPDKSRDVQGVFDYLLRNASTVSRKEFLRLDIERIERRLQKIGISFDVFQSITGVSHKDLVTLNSESRGVVYGYDPVITADPLGGGAVKGLREYRSISL